MNRLAIPIVFIVGVLFGLLLSSKEVVTKTEYLTRVDTVRDTVKIKSPDLIPEIVTEYKTVAEAPALPDSLPAIENPELPIREYKGSHTFKNGLVVSAYTTVSGQLLSQRFDYRNIPIITKSITETISEPTTGMYIGASTNFQGFYLDAAYQHGRNQFEVGYDLTALVRPALPIRIGFKRRIF